MDHTLFVEPSDGQIERLITQSGQLVRKSVELRIEGKARSTELSNLIERSGQLLERARSTASESLRWHESRSNGRD